MHETVPRWREAGWVVTLAPDFAWQPVEANAFFIDAEGRLRWIDISWQPFTDTAFLLSEAQRLMKLD
jgi:hypothetical protein